MDMKQTGKIFPSEKCSHFLALVAVVVMVVVAASAAVFVAAFSHPSMRISLISFHD